MDEIGAAGGLPYFLEQMHAKLGPIFSFWLHRQYYVSIASHKLFKEHSRVFDRPGGWDLHIDAWLKGLLFCKRNEENTV